MPEVVNDGCKLYWEICGSGPVLVVAAGLGGTATWWDRNIPALARAFSVLSFDQRGTGRSSHVPVHSIEQMSSDLVAVLNAAGADHVYYLGHSTGGAIGVATALDYPNRIKAMVVYASTTCGDPYRRRVLGLRRILLEKLGPQAYAEYTSLLLYPPYWINSNQDSLAKMEAASAKELADSAVQSSRLEAILKFDRRSELHKIAAPTMVLCCEDDILTPPYFSKELAQLIPNSELMLISRGGHAYARTEPKEFNEIVLRFFRRSSLRP